MSKGKRHARVAHAGRDHHQLLLAVLYLGGVVLAINAWLVKEQLINF